MGSGVPGKHRRRVCRLPSDSPTASLPHCPAYHLPRLSRRQGQRLSGLGSTGFPCGRYQLAQYLGRGLGSRLPQLIHCGGERPSKRRGHREARQPLFQRLNPTTVGPLDRWGIEEQILGDP